LIFKDQLSPGKRYIAHFSRISSQPGYYKILVRLGGDSESAGGEILLPGPGSEIFIDVPDLTGVWSGKLMKVTGSEYDVCIAAKEPANLDPLSRTGAEDGPL